MNVAVVTSCRNAALSCARHFAVAKPRSRLTFSDVGSILPVSAGFRFRRLVSVPNYWLVSNLSETN